MSRGLVFIVTEDWYFVSHRLPIALAALAAGYKVDVVTRESNWGEHIRAHGISLTSLDLGRGRIRVIRDVVCVFRLWRYFLRVRPKIVHNVALKPVILGTIAARLSGVDTVINALAGLGYSFTSTDRKAFVLRKVATLAFRVLLRSARIRLVVQNSEDSALLHNCGIPRRQISLIQGSGVNLARYRPTSEPSGPIVVAMVSRMLWDKGVGDLVEAARILHSNGSDFRIRLIGPTDPRNPSSIPVHKLKAWVAEGIVEWSGPVEDVFEVWKLAHIGVLPSYREGLPKSLLEAGACGRPLIATDVPGCREVVIHLKTGLLVPARSPRRVAEAIIQLGNDKVLRQRLGWAARGLVEERFSVDKITRETLSLYQSAGIND